MQYKNVDKGAHKKSKQQKRKTVKQVELNIEDKVLLDENDVITILRAQGVIVDEAAKEVLKVLIGEDLLQKEGD